MRPAGLEPAAYYLEGSCSIQLSYGRESLDLINTNPTLVKKSPIFETLLRLKNSTPRKPTTKILAQSLQYGRSEGLL